MTQVGGAWVFAHGGDDVEQRRTGFAGGEGHARGVDEDAGFDLALFGELTEGGFGAFDVEGFEGGVALGQGIDEGGQVGVLDELLAQIGVVLQGVAEEGLDERGQVLQVVGPLTVEVDDAGETLGIHIAQAGFFEEGTAVIEDHLEGLAGHVLGVHPGQLLVVEDGGRRHQAVDGEGFDHLFLGHHLAVVTGGPAEQGQVVVERLRQDALIAELLDRGGAGALGEALFVGSHDHGQMTEDGHLGSQGLEEGDVLGGVGDVVLAPQDVGDAVLDVVAHHGQVVGGGAVGAQDDEVVEAVGGEFEVTADDVVEAHRIGGHAETDGKLLPGLDAANHLGGAGGLEVPPVLEVLAAGKGGLADGVDVFLAVETVIRLAFFQQTVGRLDVLVDVGALQEGAFVGLDTEPVEGAEDLLRHGLVGTLTVRVLDAQHKDTAVVVPKEIIINSGTRTPDV